MADTKITALTELNATPATGDILPIVDVSDTTQASSGSTKHITLTNMAGFFALKASPTFTGTVTLPVGLTGVIRADSGVVSVDSDVTDIVAAASESAAGKIEIATIAEIETGTDTGRAVAVDQLAGSNFGERVVEILVSDPNGDAITVGDGKAYFRVPSSMNGMNLVEVAAHVTTASASGGPILIQIRNSTQTADMLSTRITIDDTEIDTGTAAAAAVIDTGNDDIASGDIIHVDIDDPGSGAKGLLVQLIFRLP